MLLREVDERDRVHPLGARGTMLALHTLEIVTRAEAAAGAGENHGADVAVAVDPCEGRVQLRDQPRAERVEPFRAVHGDEDDPGFDLLGEHQGHQLAPSSPAATKSTRSLARSGSDAGSCTVSEPGAHAV